MGGRQSLPDYGQKALEHSLVQYYAQAFDLLPLGRAEPAVRNYEIVRRIIDAAVRDVFYHAANVTATLQAAAAEVDALLAQSGPSSAVVSPAGGTLVYSDTQGMSATVTFAPGAVPTTVTVSYVPLQDLPTDALAFALLPGMHFSRPVTITLHYRDDDVLGMDESDLKLWLYDWHRREWVHAEPCGGYARDALANRLQAAVCHFSDYALFDRIFRLYLPLVSRDR